MESRKRALVGECISRASVEAARAGASTADISAAIGACDYERAATLAFALARNGTPVDTATIGRILPGIELPAITCSLIAITPARAELVDVLDAQRFPLTKDAAELEVITLYAAWKAGAETRRIIPHLRRLSARMLSAESYALLATIAATIDDANVIAATRPIAPFAKEYAKTVATDDKAMHASLDAVITELPTEVEASLAAGFTVRAAKQVGRNDPCPCGSGNKYKKCCADKPQAAPSPIPGLSWDEFIAGDRVKPEHLEDMTLRDAIRIDVTRLGDAPLRGLMRKLLTAHEWDHAQRVRSEAVRRGPELGDEFTDELAHYLVDVNRLDAARPLIASLPDHLRATFGVDLAIAEDPAAAYRALVETARKAVASTGDDDDKHAVQDLAYTLLRAEPALGILIARSCIGTMQLDDPEMMLELVEEARDRLNVPPTDPAWDVLDALTERPEGKGRRRSKAGNAATETKPDAALAESTARIDQLERALAATRAQLEDARTRPAAELMRTPDAAPSGLESKVRELEALIREGNAERRDLRRQLEAHESMREREESPRARRATLDEPDEGFDDALEAGQRDVTLPRFERRFVDAIDEVPAQVAAETMRTIGTLAAGDGFAWRSVKQAKDMARQVLMARVGIHHRLIFRVEGSELTALDLITREQLDTTLKRLRMNR